MNFTKDGKFQGAICGVQLKDRNSSTDLMCMLSLNETIDQLAMTYSVLWYGCVEERRWSCLEKGIRF